MSSETILKYIRQANQLTNEMTDLSKNVKSASTPNRFEWNDDAHKLQTKLVSLKVYLNEVVSELEWAQSIKTRVRKELANMLFFMAGMFIFLNLFLFFIK